MDDEAIRTQSTIFKEPRLLYGWCVSVQKTGLARVARGCWQNLARTVNLSVGSKTCTDEKSVRADRRLRTDDEAIRARTTIFEEPVFLILK
jgi:hypothetical protein